jgi:glutamate-1-semialdehyde 2,1-aminomutase
MSNQGVLSQTASKTAYRSESSHSYQLYQRALKVMPGGNTRHATALSPWPIYMSHGKGCRVTDVEGEERIDFLNNFTSLIHGHADPVVTRAAQERIAKGTSFHAPTGEDVELAELIADRVPYVETIRFCNSGTEAVMFLLRAARAFTGRPKIARFEGAYHGSSDFAQVSDGITSEKWGDPDAPASVLDPDVPPSVGDEIVVLPWNNIEASRRLIRRHANQLAGVILDPLPASIGMILPTQEFLEALREETARHGILLLSDEVMSFRVAYDGAMTESGIHPDLVSLAKIIGGGFAVGAVGGRADIMSVFDQGLGAKVRHSGTFNANPVTMAAGTAAMKLMTRDAYARLNALGDRLRDNLRRVLHDHHIEGEICGRGSLFTGHLRPGPYVNYRSLIGPSGAKPVYLQLCHNMLANGVTMTSRGIFGCLSTAMTEVEVDAYSDALDASLSAL